MEKYYNIMINKAKSTERKPKMWRRDMFEKMADVLKVCKEPKLRSHIMNYSFLNQSELYTLLPFLLERDMIRLADPKSITYVRTEKGTILLEKILKLNEYAPNFLLIGDAYKNTNEGKRKGKSHYRDIHDNGIFRGLGCTHDYYAATSAERKSRLVPVYKREKDKDLKQHTTK